MTDYSELLSQLTEVSQNKRKTLWKEMVLSEKVFRKQRKILKNMKEIEEAKAQAGPVKRILTNKSVAEEKSLPSPVDSTKDVKSDEIKKEEEIQSLAIQGKIDAISRLIAIPDYLFAPPYRCLDFKFQGPILGDKRFSPLPAEELERLIAADGHLDVDLRLGDNGRLCPIWKKAKEI